jgi:hypothetical protein
MSLVLRTKSPVTTGYLPESSNLVAGLSAPLTNLQVDTNFSVLNHAIKDEEARALGVEALKASLASPSFTGTPTAPTPSPGVSNIQIATTSFVSTALIPYATLNSPTFTGIVTGPTDSNTAPSSTLATGAWVANYLGDIPWNTSIDPFVIDNPAIKPAFNAIRYEKVPASGFAPAQFAYKGIDLGTPTKRFANIYVASGKFAANTIEIGTASLKGSDQGGVVLPTNTAIGDAANVLPANLASTTLDKAFAKSGISSTLSIPLQLVAGNTIGSPPSPVGLQSDGGLSLIDQSFTDAGSVNISNFIGFCTDTRIAGSPDFVNVVISGKVSGFNNLDFGAPIAAIYKVSPVLNLNSSVVVSDQAGSTISIASPGTGNEWSSASSIETLLQTELNNTSSFDYTLSENGGVFTFTAKSPGVALAPILTQTVQGTYSTFTVSISEAEAQALSTDLIVSDGTNSVTISDFTNITGLATLANEINTATATPGNLGFTVGQTGTGLLLTFNTFGPQSAPTLTGLTTTAGTVGTNTTTTTPSITNTVVGRGLADIEYYLDTNGGLTTTTSATNVKIGVALSATELFLFTTSTVDTYVQTQKKIELTNLSAVTAPASGTGDLLYNNTTGQFTLTPPANIDNASLTGIPTAPTAGTGTDSTQLANTAFVKQEINALIDAAPAALDTLNEIAASINDDSNFATTITNNLSTGLAAKASLTGAAFSGTVTAPTPDSTSNDTTIATTAYVRNTSANLNNPLLTGIPTAPTAAPDTDSTQLATTAFVKTAVAQGGGASNMDGGLANTVRTLATHHFDGGNA